MTLPCGCCESGEPAYVVLPGAVLLELNRFLDHFGNVFGEGDWATTQECLSGTDRRDYIRDGCTFLEPGIADESRNWHNRGALLASYRALAAALSSAQVLLFRPALPHKKIEQEGD